MCRRRAERPGRLLGAGRTGLGAGSAAIALLVPKCPLCVAAWAWALSVLGVSFDKWDLIKWPLTAGFLLLAVLLLGAKAKPWVKSLVLLGSGLCLSFKFTQDSPPLGVAVGVGTAAIALCVFAWGLWPSVGKVAAGRRVTKTRCS